MRIRIVPLVLLTILFATELAHAETYWLGRKPDPMRNEYIFDTPVPADLAAILRCSQPRSAPFRPNVKEFAWETNGTTYTLFQNSIAWADSFLDRGRLAYDSDGTITLESWTSLDPKGANWEACKEQLKAQAISRGNWKYVSPLIVRTDDATNPRLKVNFDEGRPYSVTGNGRSIRPEIAAATHQGTLYIAWQTWGAHQPSDKIFVNKVGLDQLAQGRLTSVRELKSVGALAGFAVDAAGTDFVLTMRPEDWPNNPPPKFVEDVHKTWRKNIALLYRNGEANDLNSTKFTRLTFYGLTDSGSARLVAGTNQIAAVFARRRYTPDDNLIHQEANDLVVDRDLQTVRLLADNVVSHSFDQRMIFDGRDFVTLHQADSYPFVGLIIEKIRTTVPSRQPIARFLAYTCPTLGNDVFFDLGGLVAENDGYPILFTTTRNTATVDRANRDAIAQMPADLAFVYVRRDFDTRFNLANPYDVLGSGVLAEGHGDEERFTVNNVAWNPQTLRFDKPDPRKISRRVLWLTQLKSGTKATRAKLVPLGLGKYVAMWEEHSRNGNGWQYATTRAQLLTISGPIGNKTVTPGQMVELKGQRLHAGDDALALTIDGQPHAAWVTAGATNRQLLVHTLDASLGHKAYPLRLP